MKLTELACRNAKPKDRPYRLFDGEELKILAGESSFVFPGQSFAKPISNNTLLFALYRLVVCLCIM
ncbi:MAG: hypothetical protein M3O22_01770 [Pseudomonadota bacterium]|nr:hypothetical protein [Pseudomonadota bacterium]